MTPHDVVAGNAHYTMFGIGLINKGLVVSAAEVNEGPNQYFDIRRILILKI